MLIMMMKHIVFSIAVCGAAGAPLINGGCTGGDIPYGASPFYDHSSAIEPYKSEA